MKTVVIVQARMGSARLPGKVLMNLGGKTVLANVIDRLHKCKNLDGVIIATPDNEIVKEAVSSGAHYYIGDEFDVLSRYYKCAKFFNIDRIVRITADCPFIMPDLVDKLIEESERYDYGGNIVNRMFPKGFDCEIFSFNELERAYKCAVTPYDREHVTPYIISHVMTSYTLADTECYSQKRITLDTMQDYKDIAEYNKIIGEIYNYQDCKKVMDKLISTEEYCVSQELGRV